MTELRLLRAARVLGRTIADKTNFFPAHCSSPSLNVSSFGFGVSRSNSKPGTQNPKPGDSSRSQESLAGGAVQLGFASVKQPHQTRVAVKAFEGKFLADTVTAVDLDGGVGGLKSHFRGALFRQGRLFEVAQFLIGAPRRLKSQPSRRANINR